ncbi:MAG: DUF4440 domain-containing protein [Bacteroidota bacterium]
MTIPCHTSLKSLGSLFLIASLHLPLFSQTYSGNQEDIDQILENIQKFSSYVMNSDAEKIADAYTTDGKIFPDNRDIMEGREALVRYWTSPEGYQTTYHKITPSEISIEGETAYDYGYYEGKSKNPEGQESSWSGKYVIVWKKLDNDWKIYLDMWNRRASK